MKMETFVIAVLAILQLAGLGFALYLFTRSISGFTHGEVKQITRTGINILMVFMLLVLIYYSYWWLLFFYLLILFIGAILALGALL